MTASRVPGGNRLASRGGGLAALAGGGVLPLSFAPFGLFWVAPVSVALLWLSWEGCSRRQAFWRGFWFGSAAFLGGTYWTFISIHEFGQAPAQLAAFLTLGLVAIMGLYYGLMGYAAARWLSLHGPAAWFVGLPGAWVITEWLRGHLFSGFPWLSLGYGQIDSPLGAFATLGGVFLVSWAVALLAGCIAALVRGTAAARIAGLVLAAGAVTAAFLLEDVEWSQPGEPIEVALVQGAIPQDQKWLPSMLEPTRERYVGLTGDHLDARLIIWPEAAIPALRNDETRFLEAASAELAGDGVGLIMGIVEKEPVEGHFLNRMIALGAAEGEYSKRHLVPFGEYFPVPDFVREWMRLMNLPYTDFAAGDPHQPPLRAGNIALAPSICYEDAFGREMLTFLPEAGLLVNVSNDAWFGDSIAPHQHLQIARMRSLETARPMLRATNTGISAVIDHRGRIEHRSPQFEPHVLRASIAPRTGSTPYVRFGDGLVLAIALAAVLAGLLIARPRRV